MARIRSVKPELRRDLTVADWPRECRYAFVLLWGYLDDDGRGLDDLRLLVADLFPLDRDVTEKKLNGWLDLMATDSVHGSAPICRYSIHGRDYMHAVKWDRSQRVSHAQKSKIPLCPIHETVQSGSAEETEPLRNESGTVPESFPPSRTPEVLGFKGSRVKDKVSVVEAPPRQDVEDLCSYLVAALARNQVQAVVTTKWRTDARLLLDGADRDPAEIRRLIDWTTADSFWRSNVLSMPKFREKFDQLRLRADQSGNGRRTVGDGIASASEAEYMELDPILDRREIAARLAAAS
jgi:hypothetical protein